MQDKKRRIRELRKLVDAPRFVGDSEDVLPYAWRTPPVYEGHKRSKVMQELAQQEYARTHPSKS